MNELFRNSVRDLLHTVSSKGVAYSHFLSEDEIECAINVLNYEKNVRYQLFGGYEEADRRLIAVYFADEYLAWPITTMHIMIHASDATVCHKDYLGSIIALGINRNMVGDIVIDGHGAYLFVVDKMAKYFLQNLTHIGGYKCDIDELVDSSGISFERNFLQINAIITSNRLDCYVAALTNLSRAKSLDCINSGRVFVNGVQNINSIAKLRKNDRITVRGYGKFIIESDPENCAETQKGRLRMSVKKYN